MDASASQIILACLGSGGVVSVLWVWGNANKKEYVDSLIEQLKAHKANALSSETARIAADQARSLAEKRAGALEMKNVWLKQQLSTAVDAMDRAQVMIDPGAMVGRVSLPPTDEEPSAVLYIEADRRARYLIERDEAERKRQRSLNPEADRRERERVNTLARDYLDSDKPEKD